MAQITKKTLLDADSNKFLESKGLTNITNSFSGSAWRFPVLNVIINLELDTIVKSEEDFIKLVYKLGYENGFSYANSLNNFEGSIK